MDVTSMGGCGGIQFFNLTTLTHTNMITKLVYEDEDRRPCALASGDWLISQQSAQMGPYECYVATHKRDGRRILLSEKVVLFVVSVESRPEPAAE